MKKKLLLFSVLILIAQVSLAQGPPPPPPPVGVPLDGFSDILIISALAGGVSGIWRKWKKRNE